MGISCTNIEITLGIDKALKRSDRGMIRGFPPKT